MLKPEDMPSVGNNLTQPEYIQIQYSFPLGHTWIECGISQTNNFLTALGFPTPVQVSSFYLSRNVLAIFGEENWMNKYKNDTESQKIFQVPLGNSFNFTPSFSLNVGIDNISSSQNPTYKDFFQFLFSWLTHGDTTANRENYINWWFQSNGISTDPNLKSVANRTPRNSQTIIQHNSPVLKTFKAEVDTFLGAINGTNNNMPLGFAPSSGGVPYAIGQASVVRIPVPGTNGLCIEFSPRGYVPKSGSTSTLFVQSINGKQHLRLDYGYNVKTKTVDYHWNQKGTHNNFGINDHTPTGRGGATGYQAAKYFRYAGRVLMVVGVAIDVVSIVQASKPMKRATEVVAGWAGAWAGCKGVGALGAMGGSAVAPGPGTAIGGVGGCIIGGVGGYYIASTLAGEVYDWAEDTIFTPLPEVEAPE